MKPAPVHENTVTTSGISFVRTRAGSVADFSFRYPASVKPYRFRDTEKRNCILAYRQSNRPTNRKEDTRKESIEVLKEIAIKVPKYIKILDKSL